MSGITHGLQEQTQGGTESDRSEKTPLVPETEADDIRTFTGTGEGQEEEVESWDETVFSSSSVSSISFSLVDNLKRDEQTRDGERSKKGEEVEVFPVEECAQSEGSLNSFDVLSSNVEQDDSDQDDGTDALPRHHPLATLNRTCESAGADDSSPNRLPSSDRPFCRPLNSLPSGIRGETIPAARLGHEKGEKYDTFPVVGLADLARTTLGSGSVSIQETDSRLLATHSAASSSSAYLGPNLQDQEYRFVSSLSCLSYELQETLSGGAGRGAVSGGRKCTRIEKGPKRNEDGKGEDDGNQEMNDNSVRLMCSSEATGVSGVRSEPPQALGPGRGLENEDARENKKRLTCEQDLEQHERERELRKGPRIQTPPFPGYWQLRGEAKDGQGENAFKRLENRNKMEKEKDVGDGEGDTWMEVENRTGFTVLGDFKTFVTEDEKSPNSRVPTLSSLPGSHLNTPVEEKVQRLQRVIEALRDETEGKLIRLRERSEKLEALLYTLVPSVSGLPPPLFFSSYETSVSFPFGRPPAAPGDASARHAETPHDPLTSRIESRSFYEVKMPSFPASPSPAGMRTQSSAGYGDNRNAKLEESVFLPTLGAGESHGSAEVQTGKPTAAEPLSFTSAPFCGESSCSWVDALTLQSASSFVSQNNLRTMKTIETGASERVTKKRVLSDVEGCGSSSRSSEVFEGDSYTPPCERGPPRGKYGGRLVGGPEADRATEFGSAFSHAGAHAEEHKASLIDAERGARKPRRPVASVMAFFQGRGSHSGVSTLESASACRPRAAPWVTKLREVGARLVFEATNEKREGQAMYTEDGDVTNTENEIDGETAQRVGKETATQRTERTSFRATHAVNDDEHEGYAYLDGEEGEGWTSERSDGRCATLQTEGKAEQIVAEDADSVKMSKTRRAKSLFTDGLAMCRRQEWEGKWGEEHFELTEEEDEEEEENSADEHPCSCSSTAAASSPPLSSPRTASLADFLPFLNPLSYPVRFLARVLGLNVDGSFDRWRVEIQRGSVRGTVVLGVLDATVCVGLVMGLVYLSFFVSRMVFKTMYVHVHAIEEEKVPHYFEGLTYKFWGKKPIYFSDVPADRESGWIAQRVNWYRPHGY
uniref:Transmembrane protein n=1 Tax=Neospora caninum (strain Liverpool) TaxID=572307 RepID=F0JB21_NEOCL|nr:hypothetical protein, conserved [Neospora caninum Liverpool]CEL71287.1 TPA: hypothetical protein, conserved [Neospora caninum Liverpool]